MSDCCDSHLAIIYISTFISCRLIIQEYFKSQWFQGSSEQQWSIKNVRRFMHLLGKKKEWTRFIQTQEWIEVGRLVVAGMLIRSLKENCSHDSENSNGQWILLKMVIRKHGTLSTVRGSSCALSHGTGDGRGGMDRQWGGGSRGVGGRSCERRCRGVWYRSRPMVLNTSGEAAFIAPTVLDAALSGFD